MKPKKIQFPKDESKHTTVGEWWYFNGNLKDVKGREYSYMNTLFRAAFPFEQKKLLKKVPRNDYYIYHSIISDIGHNKFYPHINYIVRTTDDSFRTDGLNVYFSSANPVKKLKHYYIEQPSLNEYRIKGENTYLKLTSRKNPLLENQNGYVNFFNRPTFYYSLTDLETEGIIFVDGKKIEVSGKSWMDHQWSDTYDISKDFWNWFSIQLENNIELVCYEYGHKGKSAALATIIYPDGKMESFHDISIQPTQRKWRSAKTKAVYDLSWEIKIPQVKMEFSIESKVENHEMNFLRINYWESPTKIAANINGKEIAGFGYMELAGRPSIFNNFNLLKELLDKKIKKRLTG